MIPERYRHNLSVHTEADFIRIRAARITVVGAGGLGGHIIDQLARLGAGFLRVIDPDVFDESNLNRQLNSEVARIGMSKAEAAADRVGRVNPEVSVEAVRERLTQDNSRPLLAGSGLVMDAVDNLAARFVIQDTCRELDIPFVHGAVGGWVAQVSLVMPGQDTMDAIYRRNEMDSVPRISVPPFSAALAASMQVAEAVKYLTGTHDPENRRLLYLDLQSDQLMNVHLD